MLHLLFYLPQPPLQQFNFRGNDRGWPHLSRDLYHHLFNRAVDEFYISALHCDGGSSSRPICFLETRRNISNIWLCASAWSPYRNLENRLMMLCGNAYAICTQEHIYILPSMYFYDFNSRRGFVWWSSWIHYFRCCITTGFLSIYCHWSPTFMPSLLLSLLLLKEKHL